MMLYLQEHTHTHTHNHGITKAHSWTISPNHFLIAPRFPSAPTNLVSVHEDINSHMQLSKEGVFVCLCVCAFSRLVGLGVTDMRGHSQEDGGGGSEISRKGTKAPAFMSAEKANVQLNSLVHVCSEERRCK